METDILIELAIVKNLNVKKSTANAIMLVCPVQMPAIAVIVITTSKAKMEKAAKSIKSSTTQTLKMKKVSSNE